MERESRFFNFPPEADDLDAPMSSILKAMRVLDVASRQVKELLDYAEKFPAVGDGAERPKAVLLTKLRNLLQRYKATQAELGKLATLTGDARGDIGAAYHDPQGHFEKNYAVTASTKVAVGDPRWRR